MKIEPTVGLIEGVPFHSSPHFNERPDPQDISLLVIHGISLPPGEFGGTAVHDLFMNTLDTASHSTFSSLAGMKVSTHVFIRREGEVIQYVPFTKRAWHAGQSVFEGRSGCNDFSIGIELEGTDDISYDIRQYNQLARLTGELMKCYPAITEKRIVGHADIAPGRKTDPGAVFDWAFFLELLSRDQSHEHNCITPLFRC